MSYDSIKTSVSNLSDHFCDYNEVIRFAAKLYSYRKCLMLELSRKDESRRKMFFLSYSYCMQPCHGGEHVHNDEHRAFFDHNFLDTFQLLDI